MLRKSEETPTGLEPATFGSEVQRDIHYATRSFTKKESPKPGSNQRPTAYEAVALPLSYWGGDKKMFHIPRRLWSSGYDWTLPTSRPGFDSRQTQIFDL